MYRIRHIKLLAVSDGHINTKTKKINEPKDIAYILKPLLSEADREHCLVVTLNGRNQISAINTVSIGTLSSPLVHPREVFKPAILTNAGSIIIAQPPIRRPYAIRGRFKHYNPAQSGRGAFGYSCIRPYHHRLFLLLNRE